MKHYNISVTGKVHGVFYRQGTLEIADQLGLKGFVRNESNGDVYLEAEGGEAQLQKMVEWCKVGPPRAHVSEVKISESELKGFTLFEIRR